MRKTLSVLAFAILVEVAGCGNRYPAGAKGGSYGGGPTDFHGIFSNSVFGPSTIHITPTVCAGRAMLQEGSATVADSCFTGDTNVVLCTNVSGLNPVRCMPRPGSLAIGGIGNDEISYARVK